MELHLNLTYPECLNPFASARLRFIFITIEYHSAVQIILLVIICIIVYLRVIVLAYRTRSWDSRKILICAYRPYRVTAKNIEKYLDEPGWGEYCRLIYVAKLRTT